MITWSCNVSRERFDDYDEAYQHEEACREKQHRSVHPFFSKEVRKENIKKKQVATRQKPHKASVKVPPPPQPSSQDIVHLVLKVWSYTIMPHIGVSALILQSVA